jgi:hypothetical protein
LGEDAELFNVGDHSHGGVSCANLIGIMVALARHGLLERRALAIEIFDGLELCDRGKARARIGACDWL